MQSVKTVVSFLTDTDKTNVKFLGSTKDPA